MEISRKMIYANKEKGMRRFYIIKIVVAFLFLIQPEISHSQKSPYKRVIIPEKKIHSIGTRQGFGFILPHRASMIHLIQGHLYSAEVFIERCGMKRVWNSYYQYPTTGVNFYFATLGYKDVLGYALAIDYYGNMHMVKKKRFLFDLRLSTGIGYITKIFDPQDNNQNIAIGSNANISIGASFDFKWKLKNYWQVGTGISLKHFSNGSFTTPNLGLNIPVLMITAKKTLLNFEREYTRLDSTSIKNQKSWFHKQSSFAAMAGYGIKEIYPAGGKKYGTYSLELTANFYRTLKSAYLVSADLIHNVALYQYAIQLDTINTYTQKDITQYGIGIGYAQVFDKFDLFIVNNAYLVNKYNKDGIFYQRIGGRYNFDNNISVQFALKTHFAKADYFEMGIGYTIRQSRRRKIVDL